ncbi:hypothetical protein V8F06_011012 [Rhypophila decipiens]
MSFTSLPRPTIASASSPPTSSPSTTPDPLASLTEYSRLVTVTDVTSWASANNATLPRYGATSGGQKGITTPVKIGVPIVCIVVGLALVGLAVWLFIRHRRHKTRALVTGLPQIHGSISVNKTPR